LPQELLALQVPKRNSFTVMEVPKLVVIAEESLILIWIKKSTPVQAVVTLP
jgi:hypothetical protein